MSKLGCVAIVAILAFSTAARVSFDAAKKARNIKGALTSYHIRRTP